MGLKKFKNISFYSSCYKGKTHFSYLLEDYKRR